MSATDELRRLLDERGVEYKTKDRPAACHADWEAWLRGDRHQPSGAIQRETLWGQPTDQNGETLKGVYHVRATEMGDRLFLEAQLVTPEQAVAATVGNDDYTTALTTEFVRVLDERDTLRAKLEVSQSMRHAEYEQYTKEDAKLRAQLAEWKRVAESKQNIIDHMRDANAENACLRERTTTQKQTIQAYRDESREWREVAERAQAENDNLRELAADMLRDMRRMEASAGMDALVGHSAWFAPKLHELGIEVDK